MESTDPHVHERTRRLLKALYREEFRSAAYAVYRRRVRQEPLRKMLGTFLEAQARMVGLLEGHLVDLGALRPGSLGVWRRMVRLLGRVAAFLTALGGSRAIMQRVCSEEQRGAAHYSDERDWDGWSEAEQETLEGHQCDQLYQNQWAGDLQRDLKDGRI